MATWLQGAPVSCTMCGSCRGASSCTRQRVSREAELCMSSTQPISRNRGARLCLSSNRSPSRSCSQTWGLQRRPSARAPPLVRVSLAPSTCMDLRGGGQRHSSRHCRQVRGCKGGPHSFAQNICSISGPADAPDRAKHHHHHYLREHSSLSASFQASGDPPVMPACLHQPAHHCHHTPKGRQPSRQCRQVSPFNSAGGHWPAV